MKKITRSFTGIMAILLLVLTAACSGDDDAKSTGGNSNDIIVGKWKYIGWYDGFLDEFEEDQDDCYDDIWTFNKDGKGKFVEEDCEDGDLTTSFNWSKLGDNKYKLSGNGEVYEFSTSFEGNDRMTILEDEDGSGEVYERM